MPPSKNEEQGSPLEELRNSLYANEVPVAFPTQAPSVSTPVSGKAPAWQPPVLPPSKRKIPWSFAFLVGAGVVFALAVLVAGYFLVFGTRSVSTDHIDIQTPGGDTLLNSGEVATILVTIKNGNPTAITNTRFSVAFPDGARSPEDLTAPATPYEDTLGDVAPGATVTRTVRVALSGAEGQVYTLPMKLEYRTAGSNAVFVKNASHTVTITSSPLTVRVLNPSSVAAGENLTLQVNVHSDAKVPMENIAVLAEYPFGFLLSKNAPVSPLFEIGTLAPGGDKTITITGTLSGEDTEQHVFRFTAGVKGAGSSLATTFAQGQGIVALSRPFLATSLAINQDTSSSPVITAGQSSEARLAWNNTINTTLSDAQVSVRLTGDALDPTSVQTPNGFYRSVDSTIVFAKDTNPMLASIVPGGTGGGSFIFKTKPAGTIAGMSSPTITATVTVTGRTSTDGGAPRTLTSTMTRTIQVGTDLGFLARSVRTTGPFKNTGAWPPIADNETTYTIIWAFTNTINAVAGASASAVLPSYVRFTGSTSPSDGSITYDEVTHTVTWTAGEVSPNARGIAKQAAFQVALLPSISQRGTSPVLMTSSSYAGTDRFTKRPIAGTVPEVSTQTVSDPAYQGTFGIVVR